MQLITELGVASASFKEFSVHQEWQEASSSFRLWFIWNEEGVVLLLSNRGSHEVMVLDGWALSGLARSHG